MLAALARVAAAAAAAASPAASPARAWPAATADTEARPRRQVPLWATQTAAVRARVSGGQLRGRLVVFPHGFLHAEVLDAHIAARLLVGKRLFQ
jgi:hypothetical protein